MSVYDRDHLDEQLQEASECLEDCCEAFIHWAEDMKDGQVAYDEFRALSIGVPLPEFKDLDSERVDLFFEYVQSQSKHKDAWTEYYCSGDDGRGDYLYDQWKDAQLEEN